MEGSWGDGENVGREQKSGHSGNLIMKGDFYLRDDPEDHSLLALPAAPFSTLTSLRRHYVIRGLADTNLVSIHTPPPLHPSLPRCPVTPFVLATAQFQGPTFGGA